MDSIHEAALSLEEINGMHKLRSKITIGAIFIDFQIQRDLSNIINFESIFQKVDEIIEIGFASN
jgi:divalent metal cation (Fe/Co/Zn/Cd) transporter